MSGRAYYQRCKRTLEEFNEAQRGAGESHASAQGFVTITVLIVPTRWRAIDPAPPRSGPITFNRDLSADYQSTRW
jgi:hypothetical protein